MMAKKSNLADLPIGNRLAKAATVARKAEPVEKKAARPRDAARDYKTVMARINRNGWAELRRLSIDLDKPAEDLLIEALNELLARHNRPALIEKRRASDSTD